MNTTSEKKRIESKTKQIVRALRRAGSKGMTNDDLSRISLRYGGCLGVLYRQGYIIKKEHLGHGFYNYVLVYEPENETIREKAFNRLMDEVEKKGFVNKESLTNLMESHGIQVKYKPNTYQAQ